jgi:Ser/Thr protein kinase RdoA (MazF antagonist)
MGALNYYSNRWWNWGTIQAYIREAIPDEACEIEPAWILDRLMVSLEEITRSVQTLQQLDLPLLQVHGDFYRRNLIIFNGRIAALIDWDETRVDWRAWEIGRAVWEFCKTAQCELNLTAARDFIEAYRLHYSLTCWTLLRILILENITLPYWAIKIVSA